jgi:hypothetical protein
MPSLRGRSAIGPKRHLRMAAFGRKRPLAGPDDGLDAVAASSPTDWLKSQIICAAKQFLSMPYLSLSAAAA